MFGLAHEFWLQPQKFFFTIREMANIRFWVGEDFHGENWTGNKDKIAQLMLYSPSGISDISQRISGNKGDSLQLPLQEEGTHMVVFNSTNSFINLDAAKFNEYLREDGLDAVAVYRSQHHENETNGKEFYQRSVKTIFQVGSKISDGCLNRTGLPLDILPEVNPYTLPVDRNIQGLAKIRFRIYFKGEPLNHALVKIWHRSPGKPFSMDTLRTNKRGWITTFRYPGPYMVSCVHMVPAMPVTEAQWQSYWSSLTFEYSQFFPKRS